MLGSHFWHFIGKIFWSDFPAYWEFFADNLTADFGSVCG